MKASHLKIWKVGLNIGKNDSWHYATHVVSPVLGMVDGHAEYVSCFGSGTVNKSIAEKSETFTKESRHWNKDQIYPQI